MQPRIGLRLCTPQHKNTESGDIISGIPVEELEEVGQIIYILEQMIRVILLQGFRNFEME